MFRPEYTMYSYVVHDQGSSNGSVHSRVLRTLLTQNIKNFMPLLHRILENALADEIEKGELLNHGEFQLKHGESCRVTEKS